ncbi:hypothetical protein [Jiangella anatolica]|uniref:hypothetical protein n=1 Tax=Jiangella anatolica TaxID=2670374 RepID=UPI001F30439B|nr:hypothetical protein [Jiangella anatolica]
MRGYAFGQFRRALRVAIEHDDPAVRERSLAKAGRWHAVLDGMARGRLRVGSRSPVADVPAWVTLEVVHGGFATGRLLAERPVGERPNRWYLGDDGQAELLAVLESGRYRVELPEDAALPTVAWLLAQGHHEAALDLVAELWPWLDRLRFTPPPAATAPADGTSVHLEPVGAVRASFRARRVPPRIDAMRATLAAAPLYDRLVELWCDTVEGPLPELDGDGGVRGGWPCRRWPSDWAERRADWLADAAALPPRHPRSNAARLRAALERCPLDSSELTGRDVGWIRRAIANTVTARGAPGSPRRAALRAVQADVAARPTHAAIARVLADRLEPYPADDGVPSVDAVTDGQPVPRRLVAKVERAWAAPVDTLVERGVIGSGDVLAEVLPQLTGPLLAAGFDDPALRRLYAQTYAAFRRRRGLLLLNLEHQVRFEELPWVSAVEALRAPVTDAARATLRRTALLALTAFPQAILPNPLVRELGALVAHADVRLPLVEEVAADIFMGAFTRKWHDAAALASTELAGTLYARYYDLPDAAYWRAHEPPPDPPGPDGPDARPVTADAFAALCAERAAEARTGGGSHVAVNGTTIEQSQILTTHNLAALLRVLDPHELRAAAPDLTERVFAWLVGRLAQSAPDRHAALIAVKNAAYAWRQAIFFASLCSGEDQRAAVDRLRTDAETAGLTRLRPAVDGLEHVLAGGRFAPDGTAPGGGRRLLGWAAGPHWYLEG